MHRHLEHHKRLPLVIPVLFYHGERSPYPYTTDWLDCFDKPELARKIYTKPFTLVDVTVVDDDDTMNHRRMAALTLLMKHIRHRDMMELLDRLPQVMVDISDEQVRVLIHYIINTGDSYLPEFMQALAERLEQKGIQKGIQQGELRKALDVARQLQKTGMSSEQICQITGLSEAELKKSPTDPNNMARQNAGLIIEGNYESYA